MYADRSVGGEEKRGEESEMRETHYLAGRAVAATSSQVSTCPPVLVVVVLMSVLACSSVLDYNGAGKPGLTTGQTDHCQQGLNITGTKK